MIRTRQRSGVGLAANVPVGAIVGASVDVAAADGRATGGAIVACETAVVGATTVSDPGVGWPARGATVGKFWTELQPVAAAKRKRHSNKDRKRTISCTVCWQSPQKMDRKPGKL